MTETWLEWTDCEATKGRLTVIKLFHRGALNNQHLHNLSNRLAAGCEEEDYYFEYNSTMSCSRSGTSICSRRGSP